MTATSTRAPGLPERYYAPAFVVEVGGQPLDPESMGDVLEVRVEMELKKLTSVDIRLNNYDDTTFDLKWSDADQFRLGSQIHVQMGYAERTLSMMRGVITTLTPDFPGDGSSTLLVRGLDSLTRLKGSKPPPDKVIFRDKADWQIAQEIGERHGLRVTVTEEGPVHTMMCQENIDDGTFLKTRADGIGFVVFMETDATSGEDTLNFIKPPDGRGSGPITTYVLAWGTLRNTDLAPSLVEFKPTMTVADQVQTVTVRGWDPKNKKAIKQTATPENTPGVAVVAGTSGPKAAGEIAGPAGREEVVVRTLVTTDEEALQLAQALLAERAYRFLTAHGKAIGLPDLRPGANVEIVGVGRRFSGTYHVTKVTHTINEQGYLTEFDVSRR
ncbi:phage late control D family protein [Terrabacter sp. RAF57]|uniref:phage late control D family protein n=1 Tax=Terrabacter sp. RAF57 TaxID=3233063 RepID=UPI003F997FEB